MNSPNSNCFPLAMTGRVRAATTGCPGTSFSPREPHRRARGRLFAGGKLFNSGLVTFARSEQPPPLVGGVSTRTESIIREPKPHVVARGHPGESARRYTRSVPGIRARGASAPSNLRVAGGSTTRHRETRCIRVAMRGREKKDGLRNRR